MERVFPPLGTLQLNLISSLPIRPDDVGHVGIGCTLHVKMSEPTVEMDRNFGKSHVRVKTGLPRGAHNDKLR